MKNVHKVLGKQVKRLYISLHEGRYEERDFILVTNRHIIDLLVCDVDFCGTFRVCRAEAHKRNKRETLAMLDKKYEDALYIYSSYEDIDKEYLDMMKNVKMSGRKVILRRPKRVKERAKTVLTPSVFEYAEPSQDNPY